MHKYSIHSYIYILLSWAGFYRVKQKNQTSAWSRLDVSSWQMQYFRREQTKIPFIFFYETCSPKIFYIKKLKFITKTARHKQFSSNIKYLLQSFEIEWIKKWFDFCVVDLILDHLFNWNAKGWAFATKSEWCR